MSDPATSPRLKQTVETVFRVEGVTGVRVWLWPGKVAVGVQASPASSPQDLLRRVEAAVVGLREPGEIWEFGLLEAG